MKIRKFSIGALALIVGSSLISSCGPKEEKQPPQQPNAKATQPELAQPSLADKLVYSYGIRTMVIDVPVELVESKHTPNGVIMARTQDIGPAVDKGSATILDEKVICVTKNTIGRGSLSLNVPNKPALTVDYIVSAQDNMALETWASGAGDSSVKAQYANGDAIDDNLSRALEEPRRSSHGSSFNVHPLDQQGDRAIVLAIVSAPVTISNGKVILNAGFFDGFLTPIDRCTPADKVENWTQ